MRRAPVGLDAATGQVGAELGRWAFAIVFTGLTAGAAAHWIWTSGELADPGAGRAEAIPVEIVLVSDQAPPIATEQPKPEPPREFPVEATPIPIANTAILPQAELPETAPEPDNAALQNPTNELPAETAPVSPTLHSAAAPATNGEAVSSEAEVASAPPGIPLPMPRPVRPDEVASRREVVPVPIMPSPALQTARASTPATVHQRPSTQRPSPAASPSAAASSSVNATSEPARQAPPQVSAAAEQAWQGRVIAHLYRRRDYPAAAQRSRLEGTATLRFRIDAAGSVLSAQIARSSGHGVLDDAVMSMIARASPVPAPPQGLAGDKLTLVVPIAFALR